MAGKKIKTVQERFWSKVDIRGEDECWPWMACSTSAGYGRFGGGSGTRGAHVFALEEKLGRPLGDGMVTRHTCDFGLCCNPKHLIEGTQAQNLEDAILRKRNSAGRGERHRSAKLTKEQVLEIRSSSGTNTQLASKFGVKQNTISQIRSRKIWRSI